MKKMFLFFYVILCNTAWASASEQEILKFIIKIDIQSSTHSKESKYLAFDGQNYLQRQDVPIGPTEQKTTYHQGTNKNQLQLTETPCSKLTQAINLAKKSHESRFISGHWKSTHLSFTKTNCLNLVSSTDMILHEFLPKESTGN